MRNCLWSVSGRDTSFFMTKGLKLFLCSQTVRWMIFVQIIARDISSFYKKLDQRRHSTSLWRDIFSIITKSSTNSIVRLSVGNSYDRFRSRSCDVSSDEVSWIIARLIITRRKIPSNFTNKHSAETPSAEKSRQSVFSFLPRPNEDKFHSRR